MYRKVAANTKWSAHMKDVETFIPVYQDSADPGGEFESLLSRTGFSVRKCQALDFSFTFSNKNQLLAALKAVNPFLTRIPEAKHSEFLSDCVTSLLSLEPPSGEEKVEAKYRLIVAHMSKS